MGKVQGTYKVSRLTQPAQSAGISTLLFQHRGKSERNAVAKAPHQVLVARGFIFIGATGGDKGMVGGKGPMGA